MSIIAIVMISSGLFFMAVSALGLITLPGLYTRAHAVAKSETFALLLVLTGMFFHPDVDFGAAIRLVFILIFSMMANPTAVHALLRAARRSGVQPWKITAPTSASTSASTTHEGDDT